MPTEGFIVGAISNRPVQGSGSPPPGHCEELQSSDVAIRFPSAVDWQSSTAFAGLLGTKASRVVAKSVNSVSAFGAKSSVHSLVPPFPTEPATLGFGGDPVREVVSARTPEGLMQSSLPFAVQIPTAPCPKIQQLTVGNGFWHPGAPEQSPSLGKAEPAPFTQRGLWCGAPPEVLWKLEIAQQGETDCHASDVGHWLAMTRLKTGSAVQEPAKNPSVSGLGR